MRYDWIQKENNSRLILLFAGWSSDARLYAHIKADGWDILVCHSFDNYSFPADLIARYETIYLYAWSLGVNAAANALKGIRLAAAFAVDGTELPKDEKFGIPPAIYDGTMNNLSPITLKKFRRRMFSSSDEFNAWVHCFDSDPDIERLKQELALAGATTQNNGEIEWTRAYISDADLIFPPKAQLDFWAAQHPQTSIVSLQAPHFVDLAKIIANTIPDFRKVAKRFSQAMPTYDSNASAQRIIADRLTALIADNYKGKAHKVLEIGQGTGLFTLLYAPLLRPDEIDYIDLYPTPLHRMAPIERRHTGNAEQWMSTTTDSWDVITSSASIQWFTDIRRFFGDAARCLQEDGILACSTFAPGNLSEFDDIRPAPLIYHSADKLRSLLEVCFKEVEVIEEAVIVRFDTAKDALLHLSYTGVGGSSRHESTLTRLLNAIPKDSDGKFYLTYRPVYIIARSPRR